MIANPPAWPTVVRSICCIGAGYVGGPTCAVIADRCPDIQVTIVDLDEERIRRWTEGPLPIYEPGLEELVKRCRGRNLHFSTDIDGAISSADLIFISVNTPTKKSGLGRGMAADLRYVEAACRMIVRAAAGSSAKIVVEKSTVPCRTAESVAAILTSSSTCEAPQHAILSNPEFLAEGTAISDLEAPDRILIGGMLGTLSAQRALSAVYQRWVPEDRILLMNVWSSELSKLAANAMLAQRISSINALSAMCEATGADIDEVVAINEYQKNRFVKRIIKALFNNVSGKRIAVFGFAFKKNTGDTRETAALTVIDRLLEEGGARIAVYDPVVEAKQINHDLMQVLNRPVDAVEIANSPYDAARGADAVVVCTEWDEFRGLDWQSIYNGMVKPASVFDGRLLLDGEELRRIGFRVHAIGRADQESMQADRTASVTPIDLLELGN